MALASTTSLSAVSSTTSSKGSGCSSGWFSPPSDELPSPAQASPIRFSSLRSTERGMACTAGVPLTPAAAAAAAALSMLTAAASTRRFWRTQSAMASSTTSTKRLARGLCS